MPKSVRAAKPPVLVRMPPLVPLRPVIVVEMPAMFQVPFAPMLTVPVCHCAPCPRAPSAKRH